MTQREFRKKSIMILGLSVLLLVCMIWDSAIFSDSSGESSTANAQTQSVKKASVTSGSALITNVQAVWISFGDYKSAGLYNKSRSAFQANAEKYFKKLKKDGINTIYFHVVPCNDAIYPSKYLKWSSYMFEAAPDYDPLDILIKTAHKQDMTFHAWLNPYRRKMGVSYNPGADASLKRIQRIVTEIVRNYDVDGIHFDDYFYPVTDAGFDSASYDGYLEKSESPISQDDWRRANVNALISGCYTAVKFINKDIIFSISPAASIEKNYNEYYADVSAWIENGCVDAIIPQLYFGFEYPDENFRFENLLAEWKGAADKNADVSLIIGLAPYKIGTESEKDSAEWCGSDDIIARQAEICISDERVDGFVLFSYSSFFSSAELNAHQRENYLKIIREEVNGQ